MLQSVYPQNPVASIRLPETLSVPQLLTIVAERQNLDVLGEDFIEITR